MIDGLELITANLVGHAPLNTSQMNHGGVRMKNTIIKHNVNLIAIGCTSVSGEAAVAVNVFSTSLPHAVDYSLDPCLGDVVPFLR